MTKLYFSHNNQKTIKIMKKQIFARGGAYTAPQIELYTAAVESGFQTSLEGAIIDDATVENWGNL